jgi:YidC/Oxa1 family membrane protein insertase
MSLGFLNEFFGKLLQGIYGVTGSYPIAIFLLTLFVKLVLLPLTIKQDKSMKRMKEIQPEINKIRDQYGNDPKLLNEKTMALYKEYKVNPAGGCLPLLLQMPILFALFAVLRDPATIPAGTMFFVWDLTKTDPYYVFPLLNGAISFLQQKVSGMGDNPQQKNMMYIFPIMMIMFGLKMPVGLLVYWVTSSVLTILQQEFIIKRG